MKSLMKRRPSSACALPSKRPFCARQLADLPGRDRRCCPDMPIYRAGLCISISNDWLQLAFLVRVKTACDRKLLARPSLGALSVIEFVTHHWHDHLAVSIAVGFVAQLVDGALGMAFGVNTSTLWSALWVCHLPRHPQLSISLSFLLRPLLRSAIQSTAMELEIVCDPGHPRHDWGDHRCLSSGQIFMPSSKALCDGLSCLHWRLLLWRGWRMTKGQPHRSAKFVGPLGLVGGFLDAVGGGGWGPV